MFRKMSFFKKGSAKAVDYKARLERKLYLAKEDPDPSFDLSNCGLKNVPKGVYSLCKVLRKETLMLHHNNISSLSGGGVISDLTLLHVLDLSSNKFTSLPESINSLVNLKELYLNNNLIKYLPEGICELKHLRVLSVPFNRLKRLPVGIHHLNELEELHLQGNLALCHLPDSLCLCPRLNLLVLDIARYTHPPNDVVMEGTSAVLSYLAAQMGVDYKGIAEQTTTKEIASNKQNMDYLTLRDKQLQEGKHQECMALEKNIAEQKEQEFKLQNILKEGKDKLMEDLKVQQMKIAEEVLKFQSKKEAERNKFLDQLKRAEDEAGEIVNRLVEVARAERQPWRIVQLQELDKVSEEAIFTNKLTSALRRDDILSKMESVLKEESYKLKEYAEARDQLAKDSLTRQAEWEQEIASLLASRTNDHDITVTTILEDEKAQQAAFARLLERNDMQSARLRAELTIIERQLEHLTRVELKTNKLNIEQLQCDLGLRRRQLSELLMTVLAEQEDRKKQLLLRLRKMEEVWCNYESTEGQDKRDYWLMQYQKLLDCQVFLDQKLIEQMVLMGVHNHLPLLLDRDLMTITEESLFEAGLESEDERVFICKAVKSYLDMLKVAPSAPPESPVATSVPATSVQPTAPELTEQELECVVCMQYQCEIVYIPCGHLCCCKNCSVQLEDCPLCRAQIQQKVAVFLSSFTTS
ncbi:E3 ubiquitin-protein ligase LRSAM1-like isoform X2 [Rhodnius prolixus]|uniref:E3 ubiquitin-protein ligase LRSAM1-like isoform X2 n=1 Tax=Rhodnius prolixus TaxID=13249 RepID=UPI003D189FDD